MSSFFIACLLESLIRGAMRRGARLATYRLNVKLFTAVPGASATISAPCALGRIVVQGGACVAHFSSTQCAVPS